MILGAVGLFRFNFCAADTSEDRLTLDDQISHLPLTTACA
jgi:hypothetical protein